MQPPEHAVPHNIERIFEPPPEKADKSTIKEKLEGLKNLDAIDQEYGIKELAKNHDISITASKKYLKNLQKMTTRPDSSIVVEIEPYPSQVVGLDVLNEIKQRLEKYVILPKITVLPISLWILLTYSFQLFRILPCLAVISPEKRCGKTTLLEVIQGLANKALMASNISMAAVFRVVEKYSPTLLIDEADTSLPGNDELRGILNSGHTKSSAYVIRVNTESFMPERFCTYTPKVLGMIGRLPDTLQDRSVVIRLRRKLASERTSKLDIDFEEQSLTIRKKCARWAEDNSIILRETKPDVPQVANDRAADNWTPLLTIAQTLGKDCYEEAKAAMLDILKESVEDDSIGTKLLLDIRTIFETQGQKQLPSDVLVSYLISLKESPWGESGGSKKPLTQNKLSALLKGFEIRSKNIKFGTQVLKGYTLDKFEEAFKRYLPQTPPDQTATPLHQYNNNMLDQNSAATTPQAVADRNHLNSPISFRSSRVAYRMPTPGMTPSNIK